MTRRRRRGRSKEGRGLPGWVAAGVGVGVAAWVVTRRRKDARALLPAEPPPQQQTRELRGPAGPLRVLDGGTGGTPVIVVHGLGGSADQWKTVLDRLRRAGRAAALDLRGHGRSGREGPFGLRELAQDVLAVVAALRFDRCVLVGHSLGAAVVLEAARVDPARVAGLVLVDPNGDQSRIPKKELRSLRQALAENPHEELRWHYRQLLGGASPRDVSRVLRDLERADAVALRESLESSLERSPLPALDAFDGPVRTVISPLNDLPYSLHRLRPGLEVRLLRGGHWLMLDHPEEIVEEIEALRGELEEGG